MVKVPVSPSDEHWASGHFHWQECAHAAGWKLWMPRNHSHKGPALALSAAFLGGLLMSDVDPLLHFKVIQRWEGGESWDTEEAGVAMC